jgi:hypothetical protein
MEDRASSRYKQTKLSTVAEHLGLYRSSAYSLCNRSFLMGISFCNQSDPCDNEVLYLPLDEGAEGNPIQGQRVSSR